MPAPERLHVHVVIDSLTAGGAEMLLAELAAAAPSAGLRLSVSYLNHQDPAPAAERLRDAGVDPALVPVSRLFSATGIGRMRRHLAALAPDVVHTHLGYADWFGGLAARSLGIPSVSTVHVMAFEERGREWLKLRLMSRVRRHTAARTVAVSAAARDALLAAGLDRADHVAVVHNGVAGEAVPGAGAAVRAELGLAADDVVAGMMTVLRPNKGHDVAVGAVRRLRAEEPRLKLLIAGDGPSRPEVERLAAALDDAVLLVGHRRDVMATLDAIDILLHPTTVDALPTALLEAMAARVPVVATAVGGIPEIVEPGRTGSLVPAPPAVEDVAAALAPLVASPQLRQRMAEAGRSRFEAAFTAASWAQRLRSLYEQVLVS